MTLKNILSATIASALMMYAHLAMSSGPTIVFTCQNGNLTRIIEAQFSEGGSAPCEIIYQKIDEEPGVSHKLWASRYSSKYCIEKFDAFIEKQRGWGWICRITELGVLEKERD